MDTTEDPRLEVYERNDQGLLPPGWLPSPASARDAIQEAEANGLTASQLDLFGPDLDGLLYPPLEAALGVAAVAPAGGGGSSVSDRQEQPPGLAADIGGEVDQIDEAVDLSEEEVQVSRRAAAADAPVSNCGARNACVSPLHEFDSETRKKYRPALRCSLGPLITDSKPLCRPR